MGDFEDCDIARERVTWADRVTGSAYIALLTVSQAGLARVVRYYVRCLVSGNSASYLREMGGDGLWLRDRSDGDVRCGSQVRQAALRHECCSFKDFRSIPDDMEVHLTPWATPTPPCLP